jgi:hypothetical protein
MQWSSALSATGLQEHIFNVLSNADYDMLYKNSLWATILCYASQFSFMVVPRVHELRFIPKWYMPLITKEAWANNSIKELTGATVVSAVWDHARPICGAVMMPEVNQTSGTGSYVGDNKDSSEPTVHSDYANGYYGHYYPNEGKRDENNKQIKPTPGTLLVRTPPLWARQKFLYDMSKKSQDAEQEDASKNDNRVESLKYRQFSKLLAKEAYWDETLKGRKMDVVCPLRFDIIPGSTVKVSSRVGSDIGRETDALDITYVGLITRMSMTFDMINATATSQYTLTHVRDASDVAAQMAQDEHPYYDCSPFSFARWTAEPCKTID